jgi:glycosyltransferase involved in cell wall biosynthesis|tara:strand:- start:1679 stop:3001 length:1323 start_codon:yes stop_codon:yes gene_type:complete
MKNTFYISCPIDTYSGYGGRSRDFVKALIKSDKYDVKIISQRWGSTPFGFIDDHLEDWGFLKSHIPTLEGGKLQEQPDIWCQVTVPNEFQKVGKYNIGLTAGIETTACASPWIEGCNRMDLILTSSTHSKNVFEKTSYNGKDQNGNDFPLKLTTPCEVLIEGADLDVYKPLKNTEFKSSTLKESINSIPESFAYLYVGHWMQGEMGEDRKNVGLLIKAFYELFKNKKGKKPALILKTSGGGSSYIDRNEMQKRIASIRESVPSDDLPNIYLLHGEFSDREMNELYNHSKVKAMVNLTKGEGFGRPLLEFSLSNKPVITTGWSGQIDFLQPKLSGLMGGKLTKIHPSAQQKDMLIEGSEWFSVDHNHIGHFFNDVITNYKEWKVKGKRQGYYSRTNFSFQNMEEQLDSLLSKYVPVLSKKLELKLPKLGGSKLQLPKLKKV